MEMTERSGEGNVGEHATLQTPLPAGTKSATCNGTLVGDLVCVGCRHIPVNCSHGATARHTPPAALDTRFVDELWIQD